MEIALYPIKDLIPHEKVNYYKVKIILNNIKRTNILFKPIIIDKKHNIIIDGHHRYHALMLLGVKHIPVIVADYSTDIKMIKSWPLFSQIPINDVIEIIERHVKKGPDTVTVSNTNESVEIHVDSIDAYKVISQIIRNNIHNNRERKERTIIQRPNIDPYKIVKIVQEGIILAPKSTNHVTYLKRITSPIPVKVLY